MNIELSIGNGNELYLPVTQEGITWTTERKGSPGQLAFTIVEDDLVKFIEGNPIRFKVDDENVFYGFIFTHSRSEKNIVKITAFDQLRYLKNKDTYVYTNKRADEFIKMVANDFNLQAGPLENTGYKIASRVEDNQTLFDMIQNTLDLTLENKKEMYVLYDDFGKITLKNISNMVVNILIDEDTGESISYSSSIDSDTYNKIKLVRENEDTGKRDVYIAQDSKNINSWGVLQHFDTLKDDENGKTKADALLKLYNVKSKSLDVKGVLGDTRVRAGCLVAVSLDLGDTKLNNMMLVEGCKHTFKQDEHLMDLSLRGGEFIA